MNQFKKKAKYLLHNLFKPIASKIGFTEPIQNEKPLNSFFKILAETGFAPRLVFDIGANYGTWTNSAKHYFPSSQYILFEPNPSIVPVLKSNLTDSPLISIVEKGIGAITETRAFTIHARNDSGNFIMNKKIAGEYGFEQIPIDMISVDDFVEQSNLKEVPDIIKIDAEGLDLDVLQGMKRTCFGKTELIFIEAAVLEPTFSNSISTVFKIMDEGGYAMVDQTDVNRPFGFKGLWLMELAFVLKDGEIIKKLRQFTMDSI